MAQAIQFTPEQQHAIEARGGSVLVSAAAGSGKTRVLVERVVGLIADDRDPVDADRLLIMTFTNAAAAKLRADLAERLAREAQAHPENSRLRRQQMRLQRASIGTVDSFCLKFVQQHFAKLDVPPDCEIGDDAELARMEQETLAAVLEQAYQDQNFRAFADLYDRGRSDKTAGSAMQELYRFVRAMPWPQRTLQLFAEQWQCSTPPADTLWGQALLEHLSAQLQGVYKQLAAAQRIVASLNPKAHGEHAEAPAEPNEAAPPKAAPKKEKNDPAEKLEAQLAEDLRRVQAVQAALDTKDWDTVWDAVCQNADWPAAVRLVKPPADLRRAADLRAAAKKRFAALREETMVCTAAEYEADRRRAAPMIRALTDWTAQYERACFEARCEAKLLDYADYEHLTLELLLDADGNRTDLCRTVSAQYSAVLVDEYQDTNALQDALYFALASPAGDNLFFVGDIKQSIYRFRQADPTVFQQKQKQWRPYPQPAGHPSVIALDANFRSAPNVIAGINFFFKRIFSPQLGGVAYGPGQELVVGRPDNTCPGSCTLDVLLCTGEGPNAVEADAAHIARRIADMMAQGYQVRGKDGLRACRYEDFCILLRGRGKFEVYEQALRAANIPVYADAENDLLSQPHVRTFAELLRVIDNPAQDIPLAAVLLSPLFRYTPDDLVALRKAVPHGSLYGAVLYGKVPLMQPFVDALQEYRRMARTLPVDRLLEELLANTGYLAAVGAMPEGARCRDDLLAFVGWATAAGRGGLSGVVRAMDAALQNGGLQLREGGGQTRPGCVSIMTVHRSKGLEFPVVFVAHTSKAFNTQDLLRPVLTHNRSGIGLMLRTGNSTYKTLPYAALAQTIRKENLNEEMRILYVALTRAQDALFVTLPLKQTSKGYPALHEIALDVAADAMSAETLMQMNSWGSWLLAAALGHEASGALWELAEVDGSGVEKAAAPLDIVLHPAAAAEPKPEQDEVQGEDEALYRTLCDEFAWQNPNAALQQVPAKVSVTAVTHREHEVRLQRPAFIKMKEHEGMTGTERGTAIHAFMQNIPMEGGVVPDLEAEVRRQIEEQLLDPELPGKVDLGVVKPLFQTALWQRVGAAQRILREEPFITSIAAGEIMPDAVGTPAEHAQVLLQGIADAVLVFEDHAEILDYKTDGAREAAYYLDAYAKQLQLYARAFAERLDVPVTKLTIYSFGMGAEIDVPLPDAAAPGPAPTV